MTDQAGPQDERLAEVLDAYVARLQAGQRPDREAILRDHPELGSLLDCLDALEQFAPPYPIDELPQTVDLVSQRADTLRDFGAYELLEEIGRGGMGVVYKARQRGLERIVAMKMILASHLASAEHVRRFQEEARAAAALRHPNIVHIHEVGQCHGQHYFTMEYIEGQNLAERSAGGALDAQSAARLVAKVARAVDHLHRQGYVHRDLKPSNILLDADGEPYVTDFGLAKVFLPGTEATATGAIVGTPSYMAPEQAAGHSAEVGPASDVYSLGAILYELLTGQPPFRQETPLDTLLAVLGGEPKPPRQIDRRVPRALEWIAMKCLARAPSQRYASAAALADDLERFLRHEELEARPPHLVQRAYRWFRREPALAARLATLLAFYTVEAVVYTLGTVDSAFHRTVSILVVIWAVTALGLQQFLKSGRWTFAARYIWGTLDSALLLAVLLVADGAASSLVVGYPLLIVASSLWYRVRFVWFTSALSLVSYGVLVWDFYVRRPELQARCYPGFERHVVFVLALLAFAGVTAHLVDRLRSLSTYYGHRGQEGRL
ncbi:MAG: serine/threonine protein kinase [Thermoguttaceae bacterium]|jgi:serine/threonine-protein kinase|nr:serine/threonine protein kinase [Thermoguttaceae bacterium]